MYAVGSTQSANYLDQEIFLTSRRIDERLEPPSTRNLGSEKIRFRETIVDLHEGFSHL